MADEIGAEPVVAVDFIGLAEAVVDGGIDGAGGHQRAELGDGHRQLHFIR